MSRVIIAWISVLSCIHVYGQDWKTLDKAKYSITYPPTWELDESGMMGTTFALFSPQESATDTFKENVNLIEQDLSGMNLDLEKFAELSTSQIKRLITNASIKSNERMDDFQKIIYDGDQAQLKLTFEQYYWVVDDKAYVLTFTAERSAFAEYRAIAEKILNSFKLK